MTKVFRKLSVCGLVLLTSGSLALGAVNVNIHQSTIHASKVTRLTHHKKNYELVSTSKVNRAVHLYKDLLAYGMQPQHARVLLASMTQTDPTLKANTRQVGGGVGYGYFQLNYPTLHHFAKAHHTSVNSIFTQLRVLSSNGLGKYMSKQGSNVKLYRYLFTHVYRSGLIPSNKLAHKQLNKTNVLLQLKPRRVQFTHKHQITHQRKKIQKKQHKNNSAVKYAESLQGSRYSMSHRTANANKIAQGKKAPSDSASFLWGVLKHSNNKVPAKVWNGTTMLSSLHHAKANQTHRGSVVYATNHHKAVVHSGLLLSRYHGKNTKVINQGGAQPRVNISTVQNSFGPQLVHHLHFANPIK